MSDPAVKIETLSAVLDVSRDSIARHQRRGRIPPFDFHGKPNAGWRLSTIRAWNPQAAAKIQRGIDAEVFPYLAAA